MDRFDEMRSRGINTNDANATAGDILQNKTAYVAGQKITGTLVPPSGGADYNVFVQNSEPENKDGIWIKSNVQQKDTYFLSYGGAEGEPLDTSQVAFLTESSRYVRGQCIVGDYMYVFGNDSSNSFKYDLKTKTKVGNISVPSLGTTGENMFNNGAIYYPAKDIIYVFYVSVVGSNGKINCYTYDYKTNTSSSTYVAYSGRISSMSDAILSGDNVYFISSNTVPR